MYKDVFKYHYRNMPCLSEQLGYLITYLLTYITLIKNRKLGISLLRLKYVKQIVLNMFNCIFSSHPCASKT